MRRGIGILRWAGDDLGPAALWVERTDADEIQVSIEYADGAEDAYLTAAQARELVANIEASIVQKWSARRR